MGIIADARHALRNFRLAPGFHVLLIAILGLGIATSSALFSIVDAVLLRPLPYRDAGRLVSLTAFAADPKFDSNGSLSYSDFEQLKARARSFEDLAITYRTGWSLVTLTGGNEPQRIQGAFVSPNLFGLLGRTPVIGRTFTVDEDRRGDRLVVLNEALAMVRYGSATAAIGKDLEIGGAKWRVIGIMPSDFRVPFLATQLWMPIHAHPEWNDRSEANPLLLQRWDVIGRLRPGVRISAAQAEVDGIEAQLRSALPDFHEDLVRVVPLREYFTGSVSKQIWILFASVMFLLLIACVNAGNLLLSRSIARQREFAVRTALGGVRVRLLRQLLVESSTFSLIAGVLGVATAAALVPILKTLAPSGIPRFEDVSLDAGVVAFALAVSMITGILLGLAPAWNMSRLDMTDFLNASGRIVGANRGTRRTKNILVAAEFAIAMVLLTGAGLLVRSFVAVHNVRPGFQPEHVLTVNLGLPNSTPAPQATQFYSEAMRRISRLPSVEAVGGVSHLFFLDAKRTHALRQVEGRAPEPRSVWKPLVWTQISGSYFQAMGISLLRGRYFDRTDRADSPLVAIVNETLAQRYWPDENPVGKRFRGFDPRGRNDDWLTVVGVVQDTRSGGLERPPFSQIYEVQSQRGDQIGDLVIRTAGDPVQLASSVRSIIHAVDPQVIVSSISTMERLLEDQEASRRFETWLIGVFSAIALSLAAFGVFAVMHYSIAARTHEIGIRMAVGARAADVMMLVVSEGAWLAGTGIAVGTLAALWTTSAIASLLYSVRPEDPVSFVAAATVLATAAILASFYPAMRASRVDPMSALRQY